MPPREKEPRDDAVAQPESGYASGQLPMKPSADPESQETESGELRKGSEAEFDSTKPFRALKDQEGS